MNDQGTDAYNTKTRRIVGEPTFCFSGLSFSQLIFGGSLARAVWKEPPRVPSWYRTSGVLPFLEVEDLLGAMADG